MDAVIGTLMLCSVKDVNIALKGASQNLFIFLFILFDPCSAVDAVIGTLI